MYGAEADRPEVDIFDLHFGVVFGRNFFHLGGLQSLL
jgi:hypothetical protein